ncbi:MULTISPECIES: hypothetical protein [Acidobacterium]|uniref:Uncharacterized protein n=1 Tax=Acidobacterium capsulatum (strain ATCC 51196 / DSM 11244 / BCRC 80197 / JCM 7670 / NBRC 15755 / NCIMB 13165 / 161) TaxID=240015 RepID=C1F9Z7_ACIC5|nr:MULTISPECIES: hypothetical protein [Acidobacterium]ACO33299.1 hypothetical protein ACP_0374 [Acidobacterium capsulatum ATCC 51196]HCT62083.1 hypothetical protein [Acidobacterium sp.]
MSTRMHECAAPGCRMRIFERFLMCYRHWNLVPRDLQQLVTSRWENMQYGMSPRLYLIARQQAIIAVAALEGLDTSGYELKLNRLRSSANLKRSA